jgi:hypothetical protein
LTFAGSLACLQADYVAAEEILTRALAFVDEHEEGNQRALVSFWLASTLLYQSNSDESLRLFTSALATFQEEGNRLWTAWSLYCLAVWHGYLHRDAAKGAELFNAALDEFRQLGFASFIATTLGTLGGLVLKEGDLQLAEAAFREALALRIELRDKWGIASHLRELAQVGATQRDARRGVRRYAASVALFESIQAEPPALYLAIWHDNEVWLRAQADDPANADAWNEGYNRPIEQALIEVSRLPPEPVSGAELRRTGLSHG